MTDSAIRRFESWRPSQPVRGPFRTHGLRFIPETPFSNFRFDMPQTGSLADRDRLANDVLATTCASMGGLLGRRPGRPD